MDINYVPPPALKNVGTIESPQNIRFILEKLGRDRVIELFLDMGILLRGDEIEIFDQCAYTTPWDYKKTKKLRDMYALSDEAGLRLTGFLIEAPANLGVSNLQSKIRNIVSAKLRSANSRDDIIGFVDATPQPNGELACSYRYQRQRIKSSDLSLFRDVPVDTQLWLYDTNLRTSSKAIYAVAIRLNVSSDYSKIRNEFLEILNNSLQGYKVRVLALKLPPNSDGEYYWGGFQECEYSNDFMTDLLERPVINNVQIKDVSTIQMFKWDREVTSLEQAEFIESNSIEEDLNYHLKDLKVDGVSLQKAKTIIAALDADKHAVNLMGVTYKSSVDNINIYTELKFKIQLDGIEIRIKKITSETQPGRETTLYDMDILWKILWDYWNKLLERYARAIGLI